MTDENYVAELRGHGMLSTNQAADRIEQLTAERDHAWTMVAQADTQMGQSLADHLQTKAERDRLREALWAILACETPNANATVTRMASITKAALKGETP